TGWQPYLYDLSAYAGQTIIVQIKADWVADDYVLAFDNFFIGVPPTCLPPTGITLEDVTAYEAEFTWDTVSNAEGYTWYVFADGADPEVDTAITTGSVTDATVVVDGL